jgi:hypothetical protein
MSRGRSVATFLFSDGTTASVAQWCYSKTCYKGAIGYPNASWREALTVDVTGPNIFIYWVG